MEVANGRIAELDIPDKLENRSYQEYDIKITAEGDADFKVKSEIRGQSFGSRKRTFAEMVPEKRDRYVQQAVASIAQSAKLAEPLKTEFDSYPGRESFAVTVDKYAVCDGDKIYFEVPNSLSVLGLRTDKHLSPYYIATHTEAEIRVNIDLPEGYSEILMAPDTKVWQLPNGAGTLKVDVTRHDNGDITIVQKINLDYAVVDPENYDQLLEINRQIGHKSMEMILVKKAG
jgi:hypothetical protein